MNKYRNRRTKVDKWLCAVQTSEVLLVALLGELYVLAYGGFIKTYLFVFVLKFIESNLNVYEYRQTGKVRWYSFI